jgi:tetratricopeptide (TPR) repeat protein
MTRTIYLCLLLFPAVLFSPLSYAQSRKIDSLIKLLSTTKTDSNRVKILNDIGGYMIRRPDKTKVVEYLLRADSLARSIGYLSGVLVANNRLGIYYQNRSENQKANEYFFRALDIAKQIGDKKGESDVISNIGISYCASGEYAKALDNYLEAYKIRKTLNDPNLVSSSLMSIGNIYYLQYKYDKALESYETVVKDSVNHPEQYFYAEALYNAGLTYVQLKDYEKAKAYFKRTLEIDNEIGDKQGVALAYSNIGSVYSTERNFPKALEFIQKAMTILVALDDKRSMAETYGEMGQVYDSLKQPKKAEECFTNMLSLAQEIQSLLNEKKAYHFLADHFSAQKDFKQAYDYFLGYKAAEDSINKVANLQTVAELQAKYETEKKAAEIEALKADQSLKESENKQKNLLIISTFTLIAILSITIFLFYNRNQLKKKNQLERKNYELERSALSAQMNPHFIFNSLASISGFVAENEKERAIEYLGVFSRLIRHNLEQSRESLISVKNEAQMLRSYLFLQQLRFNNKFEFEINVHDLVDDSMAIPPMFVQPFVENAVLHGVAHIEGKGMIRINFRKNSEETIECEVTDNGIGISESKRRKQSSNSFHNSLAMTITKERMEIMNAHDAGKIRIISDELTMEKHSETGTVVKLLFAIDHI